jgi:hypothetical protein
MAPTDQPHIGAGVMGGTKRAGRHQRGAVAREARDTMEARGLDGLGQGHRRQDGGEPAGQHRRPRPRGAQEHDVVVEKPA